MDSPLNSPHKTQPKSSCIPTISLSDSDPLQKQLNSGPSTPTSVAPKQGYKKPSKPREFARSAKRRQSVLTLGSITHLQHFYAKHGIIIKPKKPKNKEVEKGEKLSIITNISGLLQVTEEPDGLPLSPIPPSPPPLPTFVTSKLDIETDQDVLLANCHSDIQAMLEAWCMVTGEVKAEENLIPVDVLVAIETTTKALQSIKNYSMHKEQLSINGLSKVRAAALEVLEMVSDLEKENRADDSDDSSSEDGHIYKESNYRMLDRQRDVLRKYLEVVEENLLFDDNVVCPNVSYFKTPTDNEKRDKDVASITHPISPNHPNNNWVDPDHFGDNVIVRYHAFLEAHRPSKSKQASDYTPLPDPSLDKTEFLAALADGKLLCIIYDTILRRSKRPFGFIKKIHEDTSRIYRAAENLKFFAAAVKFRFDIKFEEFNVTEVVKMTNIGKEHLEKAIAIFCEKAMQELISTGSYMQLPSSRFPSMYMQETLSNAQLQLLQQATTNSAASSTINDGVNPNDRSIQV